MLIYPKQSNIKGFHLTYLKQKKSSNLIIVWPVQIFNTLSIPASVSMTSTGIQIFKSNTLSLYAISSTLAELPKFTSILRKWSNYPSSSNSKLSSFSTFFSLVSFILFLSEIPTTFFSTLCCSQIYQTQFLSHIKCIKLDK